jgi:hypothetical protein
MDCTKFDEYVLSTSRQLERERRAASLHLHYRMEWEAAKSAQREPWRHRLAFWAGIHLVHVGEWLCGLAGLAQPELESS